MRYLFYIALIYLGYRLVRGYLQPSRRVRRNMPGQSGKTVKPPPYDPNQVEDVEFREVRKKGLSD